MPPSSVATARRTPRVSVFTLNAFATRVLVAAFATAAFSLGSGEPTYPPPGHPTGVELAGGGGSSRGGGDSDDSGEKFPSQRRLGKVRGAFKSQPGGYDSQRIRRFWRHYHGARPAKKEKPLERSK